MESATVNAGLSFYVGGKGLLTCYGCGSSVTNISGVTNWQQVTVQLEGGPQQLTWAFTTGSSSGTHDGYYNGYLG